MPKGTTTSNKIVHSRYSGITIHVKEISSSPLQLIITGHCIRRLKSRCCLSTSSLESLVLLLVTMITQSIIVVGKDCTEFIFKGMVKIIAHARDGTLVIVTVIVNTFKYFFIKNDKFFTTKHHNFFRNISKAKAKII